MKYQFIFKHSEYPVAKWARHLQVSTSGYYAYINRREEVAKAKEDMKVKIKKIFDESGGEYGPDRICGILRKQGDKISYKKASEYMTEMNLISIYNRNKKSRSLTNSKNARGEGYPNLVRGNIFTLPRQAVCSDITYLKSGEGWLYMCVIKDIVTGEVLGESFSKNMKKELVIQVFLNAQAKHNLARGTIFHSDRGSQYTSKEFMKILKLYGIRQSFSRVGVPGDNAWAESFFATLKKVCIHFKHFATREELQETVFNWIYSRYNSNRVQKRLGYMTPREYATMLIETKAA